MEKVVVCPHCEEDLNKVGLKHKGDNIVNCKIAGSASIPGSDNYFTFAVITCPSCNKVIGAFDVSAMQAP